MYFSHYEGEKLKERLFYEVRKRFLYPHQEEETIYVIELFMVNI